MTQRFLSAAKYVMQQINPANLSGAIDVVIVEQEDGSFVCSPFHVRFGKLGTLIAEGRPVDVMINGCLVPELRMKLGSAGEAFFVEERRLGPDEAPPEDGTVVLTSPITSDAEEDDEESKRRANGRWGRRSMSLTQEISGGDVDGLSSDTTVTNDDGTPHSGKKRRRSIRRTAPSNGDTPITVRCFSDDDLCSMASTSASEVTETPGGLNDSTRFLSDTLLDQAGTKATDSGEGLTWQWGELPVEEHIGDLRRKRRQTRRATVAIVTTGVHTDSDSSPDHDDAEDEAGEEAGDEAEEEKDEKNREVKADKEETIEEEEKHPVFTLGDEPPEDSELGVVESVEKSANGSLPAEKSGNGSLPAEKSGNGSLPAEKSENGSVPAEKSENGSLPAEKSDVGPGPAEAIYLSEVIERPELRDLYVYRRPLDGAPRDGAVSPIDQGYRSDGEGSSAIGWPPLGSGGSPPSPGRVEEDEVGRLFPVHLSLCGMGNPDGPPGEEIDAEHFRAHMVLYEEFCRDPDGVLANPDLVVQLNGRHYTWPVAAPLLVASLVYQCELPPRVVDRMVQKAQARRESKRRGSYFSRLTGWGRSRPSSQPTITTPTEPVADASANKDESPSERKISGDAGEENAPVSSSPTAQASESAISPTELCGSRLIHVKTLRLTSAQLHRLKLQPGANTVEYRVTSQFQGTARCNAHIFLWRWTDKVVVSDIDGTITQSDVMGQLGPFLGRDVSQRGIATLYSGIAGNRYRVLYLSSRAIGQAHWTRSYLQSVVQERGARLPMGPLLLSPTSLLYALVREIRNRPEDFKIPCLRDVRSLFPPNVQPFYAGFGNKVNDVRSYQAVGIHPERIFVVDRTGALKRHSHMAYRTSYSNLGELVHHFFPERNGVDGAAEDEGSQFSNFEYWRTPVETLEEEKKTASE